MDYILKSLERKLNYCEATGKTRDLAELYRVKIEYGLVFLLGILWGENFENAEAETKEYVLQRIRMPSIGSMLDIARKLDVNKSVFSNKQINEAVGRYPKLRNERLGHGYVFEDGLDSYLLDLRGMANQLYSSSAHLRTNYDLIVALDYDGSNYMGMNFKADGVTFVPWMCPDKVNKFDIDAVYAFDTVHLKYYRLSPFVYATTDEEFYIFKDIEESLTGRVRYNQIIRTGTCTHEWDELSNVSVENSAFRRKSINGTIVSLINKNYKRYIEIGAVKRKLSNFLFTTGHFLSDG